MTGQTTAVMAARDPDVGLMVRVRAGDDAAFAELVDKYQHRLLAVLAPIVGRREEAEDLAQEVFLRVHRTRHKYTPTARFATWLFTIANNLALNALRDRKRKPAVPLDDGSASGSHAGFQPPAATAPPAAGVDRQELAAAVQAALNTLNERQRLAVVLNKFEDMGYADIGAVMGLSVPAVKSLLSRAREQLRAALAAYTEAGDG
jgi:RNA polymerase sigma-70 factor (ECF subfamily)